MALMGELNAALAEIAGDPDVKVVVIRGNGPAFCAGHDLKEMRADDREEAHQLTFRECATLMTAIVELPKPVCGDLRPGNRRGRCALRHARRQPRPVLLDADGGVESQRKP
jgi:1,4-dihydroxy-2-naphthoyl-CoA synthase